MTTPVSRPVFSAHLVFGFVVIAIGVLFTLDNLNIADGGAYLSRYWPAGLIAIGAAKMFESRVRGSGLMGGALFAAVGTWLLLDNLRLIEASFLDFWPVLLVIAGAMIIWQGMHVGRVRPATADPDSVISAVAVLSGVNRGSNSSSFRGGELTAFMGACEIDLRQASISGEAVMDVFAMWGGVEIQVPDNWRVIGHVTPLLGGFDDKTRPPQSATAHTLIVRGVVIMGGVEIKN
jgi:predicted membrane protein